MASSDLITPAVSSTSAVEPLSILPLVDPTTAVEPLVKQQADDHSTPATQSNSSSTSISNPKSTSATATPSTATGPYPHMHGIPNEILHEIYVLGGNPRLAFVSKTLYARLNNVDESVDLECWKTYAYGELDAPIPSRDLLRLFSRLSLPKYFANRYLECLIGDIKAEPRGSATRRRAVNDLKFMLMGSIRERKEGVQDGTSKMDRALEAVWLHGLLGRKPKPKKARVARVVYIIGDALPTHP